MKDEIGFDLEEAHTHFAKITNGRTWELLTQERRTEEQDFEMQYAAISSLYHWSQVGTALHQQRGEWLIAHVYTVLGFGGAAHRHASRCYALTQANQDLMQDFDTAYAFEAMARAKALQGEIEEAKSFYEKAREAGEAIRDEEDRSIFMGDFESGDWFGLISKPGN